MKKIVLLFTFSMLIVALCAFLGSCNKECEHVYDNDCDITCNECDATREALHVMNSAYCTTPATCTVCGATEGDPLGHKWDEATCTDPMSCSVCGAADGEAMGHDWEEATCTEPKGCSVCGETKGEPLGHTPAKDDEDCTTDILCSECGDVAVHGNDDHVDEDSSGVCDNNGCDMTVESSIEEEEEPEYNGGNFDFPMDENP